MIRFIAVLLFPFSIALGQIPESRFSVSASAGYAWFSPTDLNNYIKSAFPEIKGGVTFGADIGYYVAPQLSLQIGAGYMRGLSEETVAVTGPDGPTVLASAKESFSATSILIGLGVRYHLLTGGRFGLSAGAFAEMHMSTLEYELESTATTSGRQESRSKTALGIRLSLAAEYALTENLGVAGDFGYRLININDVNGQPGFLPAQLSLDLGGPYAMAGMTLRF